MRRPSKWLLGFLWLLVMSLLLSSCTQGGIPLTKDAPSLLPPYQTKHVAPIGDAALEYTAESTLFLPKHDGTHLTSFTHPVVFSAARPQAESLVQALLAHEGTGVAAPLGGGVKLSLFGANPVEVSRNVATVNLAASALQLDRKTFYLACQAMTNTLTMLSGIHYVNFLVMDRQVGLDIAGTLPTGAFTRSISADIGGAYEQMLSQRAQSPQSANTTRLSAMVTLYFPLTGLDGVLPEVRSISFENQSAPDMIVQLLRELGAGSQQVANSPALPLLGDILTEPPTLTETTQVGGKLITLRFAHNLDDMLITSGLTRANCMASICYTLATFLPNIAGLRVYVGNELMENVLLSTASPTPALLFENSLQQRKDFSAFMLDLCTLYFAEAGLQKLIPVQRAIPYYQTTNPRALLLELSKGPLPSDSIRNAQPIMPQNIVMDADLLGFSLSGDTLLVNFSQVFGQVGHGMSSTQDRLLAYSLTNTLCALPRIRRCCYFVIGNIPSDFSGEIYWAGDFFKNTGLVMSVQ